MTSPADQLRAAAALLRARATAASTDPEGNPTADWHYAALRRGRAGLHGDHLTLDDGRVVSWPSIVRGGDHTRPSYMYLAHAAYAATMGPVVGLALADWLEAAAADAQEIGASPQALAVAHQLLGSQP
ncbi:hypothetical protein [Streptomyces sp. SID8352]|uniref:hypothetical protein n=1 Tax=Streptomyces sp. SID8352 TaxID=2690338 RepID=UPI0013683641|nr:hypothetical protein [Streptomyces sp. SID8352]MYU20784.1 hypothetical protein [Streptomyces sp. SID8352]